MKKFFIYIIVGFLIVGFIFGGIISFIKYTETKTNQIEKNLSDYSNDNFFAVSNDYFFGTNSGLNEKSILDQNDSHSEWKILYMTKQHIYVEKNNVIYRADYSFENKEKIFEADFLYAIFINETLLFYRTNDNKFLYDFSTLKTTIANSEYEYYLEECNEYYVVYEDSFIDKLVDTELKKVIVVDKTTNESKEISKSDICQNNAIANYLNENYSLYWDSVEVVGENIYFVFSSFELRIALKYNFEKNSFEYHSYVNPVTVLEATRYHFE
jgi:hypothetical protein